MATSLKRGTEIEVLVQGLTYKCPPTPTITSIRGSNRKKVDQVWHRDLSYEKFEWNIDPKLGDLWFNNPAPGQLEWHEEEIKRLHVGSWVMINGEPTYFNNYCYFFHQWFKLLIEQTLPLYKETSLEYFRFYQLCEDDPVTLGDCGIKGRRVGLSSMSASIKLLIAIIENNTLQGIVSKTGDDAQEMYFMVKNGLENLPLFLVPELNKVTESEIHIAKQAKRISANNKTINADKGKNNRINWLDTAENAYDGRRARHITIDEAAKWVKVNVQICLSKISEALVVGASVGGHVSVFSTVNKGDKGGDNFRQIWDGSDHITGKKDMFGRTKTKLKRFFIAGYRGLLGYVGKYGESVIDDPTPEQSAYLATVIDPSTGKKACPNPHIGSKRYLQETRDMLASDPELLSEEIRKYPFEWKEVFKGANNRCNFDLEALNQQIEKIEQELEVTGNKENGRRMSMRKLDDGRKVPVDDPAGMWYFLKLLDAETNKILYRGSIKCPDNTIFGAAGLDTYANSKATVDKGSDACVIVHERYNGLNPETSGMPVAMFIGRPSTKETFHDQVYWGLEYFGIKMLAERAPTDWEDYATSPTRRLASPLDHDRKFGYLITTKRANGSEVYGIAPQDKEAREQHLTEMIEYSLNNIHKIRFLRLLRDMRDFDINDRTDYDACMAWGYALMGLKDNISKAGPVNKVRMLKIKRSKKYY